MNSVAISQPTYLPWLGYFKMIESVDAFVFLDNVQFEKRSWQCRNRIKDNQDQSHWLTVPIAAHDFKEKIFDITIASDDKKWQRKHLNSIKMHLGKTPHFEEVIEVIERSFKKKFTNLSDFNIDLIQQVSANLGLTTKFYRASELNVYGKRTDLLLDILNKLNAKTYLSNLGSKDYLQFEEQRFQELGIELIYQKWQPPAYQQRGGAFVDKLAWVDPVSYLGFSPAVLLK